MTPFKRAEIPMSEADEIIASIRKKAQEHPGTLCAMLGLPLDTPMDELLKHAVASVRNEIEGSEVWLNDTYQVSVRHKFCDKEPIAHLSIKRIDRQPVHDWRDLQRIKSELCGPDAEGCELYPAESRVVDTANQYHLWVFLRPGFRFPFGFTPTVGVRTTESLGKSVNRKFGVG